MADELAQRKTLTFEQAEGVEPLPQQLQLRELSQELRVALAVMFLVFMPQARAETVDDRALNAYQLGESDAKAQLDSAFEAARVEKKRKEAAGEPPVTAKATKDGLDAVRFLIYNRAATNGICFAAALNASANFDAMKA